MLPAPIQLLFTGGRELACMPHVLTPDERLAMAHSTALLVVRVRGIVVGGASVDGLNVEQEHLGFCMGF